MKKILYLSLVDWFWIKQRPQHISQLLSKSNKVTYLCKMPWKRNSNVVCVHDMNDNNLNNGFIQQNENMKIIRKMLLPKENMSKAIKKTNHLIMRNYIKKLNGKDKYDVIIITHPSQYDYIPKEFFNNKTVVYDCMDNYKCWTNCDYDALVNNEHKLIKLSKYIIVSSEELYKNVLEHDTNVKDKLFIINNGVDIDNFNSNNIKKENEVNIFRKNSRKKVGYIGTISEWVDLELIREIALKNKDLDFYFIGPIETGTKVDIVNDIENIIFTGSQPYYSVPNILNKLDVAIMPFKKTDLVKSVNPVKIYEYLALGKSVIALSYEETEKFGELIYTYSNGEAFQFYLTKILNEEVDKFIIERRINFAGLNSWESRVKKLQQIVER